MSNSNKRIFLKTAFSYITIVLIAVLLAFNYQLFIVQNGFAPAGLNGIATMIQYKTGIVEYLIKFHILTIIGKTSSIKVIGLFIFFPYGGL